MANYYTVQNDLSESQQELDFLSAPFIIPAGKLDADQYSAEDMDGVTESLFGSGNLSFLSMQSGQTNDAILLNAMSGSLTDDVAINNLAYSSGFLPIADSSFSSTNDLGNLPGQLLTHAKEPLVIDAASDVTTSIASGGIAHLASSNLKTSALSAPNSGTFSPSEYITMNGNMGDSTIGGSSTLFTIENNAGDTVVENIIHNNVTEVVNTVTNNVIDIGGAVTTIIHNVVGDTVTNITNNLIDLLSGEGHIAVNLDVGVLDTVGAHVGLLIEDTISGDITVNAITTHLNDVVQGLTGLNIPIVADLGATIGFNLLNGGSGTDNAAGDTDLVINGLQHLGINLPEIVLDPLESLVGDIDITLNLPEELLNPLELLNDVHDLVGGLGNLDLATLPEILDIVSAQNIDGALGIEFFDHDFQQDLALTVGDVLGNIDTALNDALDFLGGGLGGGGGPELLNILGNLWTESGISNDGLFGDIIQNSNIGDILPDPISGIAEGLGALDIPLLNHIGGGLGGLFG